MTPHEARTEVRFEPRNPPPVTDREVADFFLAWIVATGFVLMTSIYFLIKQK